MTRAKVMAPSQRRALAADFDWLTTAVRRQLGSVPERPAVHTRHVGALLAVNRTEYLTPELMRIAFEDLGAARWAAKVIDHRDIRLSPGVDGAGSLLIRRPQEVLGRYGFHDERWVFGLGMEATLGISRGAVHGAGAFTRQGLKVSCPTVATMLTLFAVMGRLGIAAKLARAWQGVIVSAGDVPQALDLLGISGAAGAYQQLLSGPGRAA